MVKKRAQRRAADRRGAGSDARWLARAPLGVPRQHGRCDHRGSGQSRPARLAAESLRVRGRCGDGLRGEPAEPEPGWWHIYPLEGVSDLLILHQTDTPTSYRLIKRPITKSCMRSVLEKHPLEGSRQEAILPLAQLLTTFFC